VGAQPGAAAPPSAAGEWCKLEFRAWQRQFGPEGARAWRAGNRSIRVCTKARTPVVEPMDSGSVDSLVALHLQVIQACGAQFQADQQEFRTKYGTPDTSPFGACTSTNFGAVSEIQPPMPGDLARAADLCRRERRAWRARGESRTWAREHRTVADCARDQAPLVSQIRAAAGSPSAFRRALRVRLRLRVQLLEACIGAREEGRYRVELPARTRLGTCVRKREGAALPAGPDGAGDARFGVHVSLRVAAGAVLMAWLLACALLARARVATFTRWSFHAAFSVPLIVACAVVIGTELFGNAGGLQLDSRIKKVVLPLVGLAFLVVALRALRERLPRPGPPDLVPAAVAGLTLLGAVIGLALGNETSGLLEDLGLGLVFVAAYTAGRVDPGRASRDAASRLIPALVLVAAIAAFAHAAATPLYGFPPAVAFATVVCVARRDVAWPWLVPALGTLVVFVRDSTVGGTVPSSVYLQVAAGTAVVAYLLTRRVVPTWAWAGAVAVIAVVALTATDARSLVTAKYDGDDLSFAQRTYEARAVRRKVDDSAVRLAAGAGLGATVDLSRSPDAATLKAARGDAEAVNDVHLLPYDLLRRHGLLGVLWLGGFLALCLFLVARARRTDEPWDVLLLLFLVVGTTDALPAASHLFANPLVGFSAGALVGLIGARAGTSEAATPAGSRRLARRP
jgi:hypothetical protein